jgi:sn-glycerol 3-phosphate transport system ATP-binding protein
MAPISIRNVKKSFGKTDVVHGISLEIANRSFVALLGPSGCGKSTVLRMIAGLEGITAGEIAIDGQVVNRLEPRERGCAMVFQNFALYPHMTVEQNIGYALKVAGVAKAERRTRVEEAARIVGLEDFLARRPGQLSGGQRQRVAMARAIVRRPKVFLFDEPLSNLDAKLRAAMRLEIRRLHNSLGATSVFVTHDQGEALTLADVVVVMNAGRIEQIAAPGDLYRQPATRFVATFIGTPPMNIMRGTVTAGGRVDVGGGVTLPFDRSRFPVADGQTVDLGVRPEDLSVAEAGQPGALTLDVELVEDLGATRLVYGKAGAIDLALSLTSSHRRPAPGAALALMAPEAHVHLFHGETGVSLRTATAAMHLAAE